MGFWQAPTCLHLQFVLQGMPAFRQPHRLVHNFVQAQGLKLSRSQSEENTSPKIPVKLLKATLIVVLSSWDRPLS
jgi:hypothetical protein